MNPERREQVRESVQRLAKLSPDQRSRELEALGAENPELRCEVEVLLASGEFEPQSVEVSSLRRDDTSAVTERRRDRVGQVISHYRIEERLGGGGMGVVYKAHDTRLGRHVALKFLPPAADDDDERLKRLIVEARAASALDHPNICTIHQIDQTNDGHWFIVMAYYRGETLKKRIERGALLVEEVLDFGAQIAQGLVKAHKEGIVHRDLKPANLMVTDEGVVKIVDFGLAQLVAQTKLTMPGTRLGTPAYMSPEQAQGQPLDHRTDIWSLGIVLYEMLAGRSPFTGEYELAIIYSIVNEQPAPISELRPDTPPELARLIEKALSKNPDERYQQIEDLLHELEVLRGTPTTSGGAQTLPGSAAPSRKNKRVYLGVAIAAAALLAVVLSFMLREPASQQSLSRPPIAATEDAEGPYTPGVASEVDSAPPAEVPSESEAAAAATPPAREPEASAAESTARAPTNEPPASRAVAPVRSWPPPSGRWALIIGVEQYTDRGITPFRGAARDAAALQEALLRYAGFPQDQVTVLSSSDVPLRSPTRANIETYLQSVTRLVPPEGLLLFCFIGHAATLNGQPVLLPVDVRSSGGSIAPGSALRLDRVRGAVKSSGIRQAVVMFDGFRQHPVQQEAANSMSQVYARGLSLAPAPDVDAFAAFYAASPGERAYEHPTGAGGYFVSVLVEGLKGAAADDRGGVTLGALDRYVRDVVPKRVLSDLGARALQRPFSEVAGYASDEVVVATVARRELTRNEPSQPQARPMDSAAQELAEWTRIRDSEDVAVFEAFLRRYSDGALRQEAQSRIDDLRSQETRSASRSALPSISQIDDPAVLERYLRENPNSRYAAQAKARLDELRPPPPPEPAPVAQPQPPVPSEADAIRDVLRRYGAAYRARDVQQVAALWPSLTADQVRRLADSFRVAVSIEQDLEPLAEPEVRGDEATVRCRRSIRYEDERGPQKPVEEVVTVVMRKQQRGWVIQAVN